MLSHPIRALLRIMWRVIYAHFVKVLTEHKAFIPTTVHKDILKLFMSRILAYQDMRRKFYYKRKYSHLPKILSKKLVKDLKDLGTLNINNGRLNLHSKIINIFKKHKVWNDYNKKNPR